MKILAARAVEDGNGISVIYIKAKKKSYDAMLSSKRERDYVQNFA
jgi:hypothetical protein